MPQKDGRKSKINTVTVSRRANRLALDSFWFFLEEFLILFQMKRRIDKITDKMTMVEKII